MCLEIGNCEDPDIETGSGDFFSCCDIYSLCLEEVSLIKSVEVVGS